MGDTAFNVALIGYGLAGSVFHGPLLEAVPEFSVRHVVTRDPVRADAALARHAGVSVHRTAEEVWQRSGEIDLVVVAAPNGEHARLARKAVDARIPVVVDKPLASTLDEARDLVHAAERAGVLLTVFQNRRWDGDFLTVRRLIGEGLLGEVHRFESRFERWRPQVADAWREDPAPSAGGGLLLDLGSHLIDQALVLFGPAREVYAEIRSSRAGASVDDDDFVAIEHSSGVVSHLWMSSVAADLGPRFRVLGSAGAFVKHGLDPQEEALSEGADPRAAEFAVEAPKMHGTFTDGAGSRAVATDRGRYLSFYEILARALTDGSPPPVDPHDALATLEIVEKSRILRK